MQNITHYEEAGRKLEPTEAERSQIMLKALGYLDEFLRELPGRPGYRKGSFEQLLSTTIEDSPKDIDTILRVLKAEVDASGISSASGRHLGFIPGGGLWASALADLLADVANKYSGIAFSGPGVVKMENQVIGWLNEIIGYPKEAFGNLTSGGSIANLIAIKAARDDRQINSTNVRSSVIYYGAQTHHSVYKALHTTGLHEAVLREIPLTWNFRIDTTALRNQLAQDQASGLRPFLIIGSAGTTDTGAVDPLDELADIAMEYRAWLHVDAAYGGFFVLIDELKEKLRGIERSDSVVLDPHKTLFLPFGSGAVLVKDRRHLLASNSSRASYLVDTEGVEDISPADTGIELSRPNRALRIWLPLQLHGVAAFRATLQEKLLLSDYFYQQIAAAGFETGPEPDLTVSIFRYPGPGNEINQKLIDAVHADGRVFLSSTVIQGKLWLRCAVVSHRTHNREIDLAIEMLKETIAAIVKA